MWEGPHEQTTLLAKHSRNHSKQSSICQDSKCNSDDDSDTYDNCMDSHEKECNGDSQSQGTLRIPYSVYLIEPMVLLLVFAYNFSATIIKNQIIYQTCVAIFNYNETDCRVLGTKNVSNRTAHIEAEVQPYATRIFMVNMLIDSLVPALCGTFIGAWSDRFGRKPLLLAAYTGYALFYSIDAVISYVALHAIVNPWYYLLAMLPGALLGGSVTYSVAAWCYISDVSTESERPYRMAFYEAAIYAGLMFSSFSAGFIYEVIGAPCMFVISACIIYFAIGIIAICMPESLQIRRSNGVAFTQTSDELASNNSWISNFRQMWQAGFRERESNDRIIVWLSITCLLILVFIIDGSMIVFYPFVRMQFHWTIKAFTLYEAVGTLVAILGNLIGVWLLRKRLHISVPCLAIVGMLSQFASFFMKGFAFVSWQMYLAIALGAFKSLSNPMCRTIITNIIPANELAKTFCLLKIFESLLPFMSSPIYTIIYSVTVNTFPGFFNVFSANLLLLAVACLLVILRKKQNNLERYAALLN